MATDDDRIELRTALKAAVQGETRYGIRDDCRAELDARWDRVIAAMERLCATTPKARK